MAQEKSHLISMDLNKKYPLAERGEGIYLYDDQGKRYIDGAGGAIVVNVGHGLTEFAEIMRDQAAKLAFVFRLHMTNQPAQELARKLCKTAGGLMDRSFFVNSGSEATETCVKLARKYHLSNSKPIKFKVISRWQSYHGITMGALSWSGQTKRRADYIPYLQDSIHIPPAYCYRCWFDRNQKPANSNAPPPWKIRSKAKALKLCPLSSLNQFSGEI